MPPVSGELAFMLLTEYFIKNKSLTKKNTLVKVTKLDVKIFLIAPLHDDSVALK